MLQIEGPLCRIGKFPASRLGFDLHDLVKKNKLAVDYVHIERSEIEETGEYDLEGLFIRLDSLIREIGARRVVLDTVEALFTGIPNEAILRAELRRLFRWLKERGVTSIITGEKGVNSLTRHGLEEYVSDCVILLDHRVSNQISTRRLRVLKEPLKTYGAFVRSTWRAATTSRSLTCWSSLGLSGETR